MSLQTAFRSSVDARVDEATARVLKSALSRLHDARHLDDGRSAFQALVVLRNVGVLKADALLFRLCSEARACVRDDAVPPEADALLSDIEREAGVLLERLDTVS